MKTVVLMEEYMRKKKHKKKNKNMKKREIQKMQVENQQEVLGADVDKNQVENQQEILVDAAEKEQRRTTRLGAIIAIVAVIGTLCAFLFKMTISSLNVWSEQGVMYWYLQALFSFALSTSVIIFIDIAGVEMEWTVGILNVNGQEDVKITGKGCIDGQGPYWWNKYWGEDRKGGMRKVYEAKGLRWCVDYDCRRSRNLVVMESKNVNLSDFESRRSGFWNIHICYSKNIHVEKLHIYDNEGPSTDGIDIDSCDGVVVERCKIACNDDSICVKSGRDADGLRVNRICQNILIQECEILTGSGVTIGSETSGGARNITIRNLKYHGTDCGFRLKSARTRGGVIEDVLVENLKMVNVKYPFSMCLDWNPSYSYCEIPKDYQGEIPEHWRRLAIPVPEEKGIPQVKNLIIRNVISENEPDYAGISRAFDVSAFPEHPITHVTMENIKIQAKEFGKISGIKDWKLVNVEITTEE